VAPLDSARAKLNRAQAHLETLEEETTRFFADNAYPIVHDLDADRLYHRYRVKLGKPFPKTWPLIIGDCAHNARSALDHIAWELAGSDPGDRQTQFPIFVEADTFASQGVRTIAKVPPRPRALIKWLQPCRRPNPPYDPLWGLHVLDAEDKHKTVSLALSVIEELEFGPRRMPAYSGFRHELTLTLGPFDPSEDEAVIAEGRMFFYPLIPGAPDPGSADPDGIPDPNVEVDLDPTFGIAIRIETAGMTLFPATVILRNYIACATEVVQMFERYL